MRRSDLEPWLRAIDPRFHLLRYSNRGYHVLHGGNDAVYFGGAYVCVVPVGNIYLHGHEQYRGSKYRNRSLRGLLAQLKDNTPVLAHRLRQAERNMR